MTFEDVAMMDGDALNRLLALDILLEERTGNALANRGSEMHRTINVGEKSLLGPVEADELEVFHVAAPV